MNLTQMPSCGVPARLALLAVLFAPGLLPAQTMPASTDSNPDPVDTVVLSPFEVSGNVDGGYVAGSDPRKDGQAVGY